MIFKIQRHVNRRGTSNKRGSMNESVVPYENFIFEGKAATYYKVCVKSQKEFEEVTNQFSSCRILCGTKFDLLFSRPDGVEFIVLRVEDEERFAEMHDVVIAVEASLYVMNDQGKTVDSVHCYMS